MGRYTGPKAKLSRREGTEVRDGDKKVLSKRNYPPGVHGPMSRRRRMSSYGKQLREKQKAKRMYGMYEKQFRNLYYKANSMPGDVSINLQRLLESRLDNVIYRLGWASSRPQARQLVTHGHIQVNGDKVDIPSYMVKPGMTISIKESYQAKPYWKDKLPQMEKAELFSWLTYDAHKKEATVTTQPDVEEIGAQFDPTLIIEFYSK